MECSVCLENYKDAVSLDKCGHTLCEECALALPLRNCPECRVPFTSTLPNWTVRHLVEAATTGAPAAGGGGSGAAAGAPQKPMMRGAAAAANDDDTATGGGGGGGGNAALTSITSTISSTFATPAPATLIPAATTMRRATTAAAMLGRPCANGKHVFYFDDTGRLLELFWSNRKWKQFDHRTMFGAVDGAVGRWPSVIKGHVFYRTDSGHVIQSTWQNSENVWAQVDHTTRNSCPLAASDPIATTNGKGPVQVFFRSTDNSLVEMYSDGNAASSGLNFQLFHHGLIQGEPAAVFGRIFVRDDTGRLILRGWNKTTKVWEVHNLEEEVGAPPPVGRISVVQFSRQLLCIAYYRDMSGHVHEISVAEPGLLAGSAATKRLSVTHCNLHTQNRTPVAHSDIVAAEGVILYANETHPGALVMCVKEGRQRPWTVRDCPQLAKAIAVNGTDPVWRLVAMRLSSCSIYRDESYMSLWIRRQTAPASIMELFMPCHAWKVSDTVSLIRHG